MHRVIRSCTMVLARRAQGDARFECIGRADVGFWRSRPDRNANASASNDDTSTGEDFSLLDEILDHLRVVSNHVCGSVGIDFVHQSGPNLEADQHLVSTYALEGGRDIAHCRHHALTGEHGEFGRLDAFDAVPMTCSLSSTSK